MNYQPYNPAAQIEQQQKKQQSNSYQQKANPSVKYGQPFSARDSQHPSHKEYKLLMSYCSKPRLKDTGQPERPEPRDICPDGKAWEKSLDKIISEQQKE